MTRQDLRNFAERMDKLGDKLNSIATNLIVLGIGFTIIGFFLTR